MTGTLEPFTFLETGLPAWITDIARVRQKIQAKQNEVAKIPIQVSQVAHVPRKTASTESLRPNDNKNAITTIEVIADATNDNMPSYSPITKRKRNAASIISGHASGALKYRSRTLIIVYYDSEVQTAFEELVRNIGTGRNMLRKGKMAAKMEALAEMANIGNDDDSDDSPDGYKSLMPNIRTMRTRATANGGLQNGNAGSQDAFELADKSLEKAQSFCERGAHQFLRDGDCSTELDKCLECFEQVQIIVQKELARRGMNGHKNGVINGQRNTEERKMEPPQRPQVHMVKPVEPKLEPMPDRMDIEVDDDDDEETCEIDLAALRPSIRMTSRR